MDFNFSKVSLELQNRLNQFFDDYIFPNEIEYDKQIIESGNSLYIPPILEDLKMKQKIKNFGIYFYLTKNMVPVFLMLIMHL